MGEGSEGRRLILLPPRRRFIRLISCLIPLVLIVVTVETEQLPVAPVGRIIVVVVVFVMDRELVQLLAVKFTPAVRTDPWKQLKCAFPKIVVALRLVAPCHASLRGEGHSSQGYFTASLKGTPAIDAQ